MITDARTTRRSARAGTRIGYGTIAVAVGALLAAALPAAAGVCRDTATTAFQACKHDVKDNCLETMAICYNLTDADARADCLSDAQQEKIEGREDCRDVRDARLDLCDALGEAAYDPSFDPADFATGFGNDNPYFPLAVGNTWEYESQDEEDVVEVLDKTKLIDGVTCVVVHDVVSVDGRPTEDTDDWIAQGLDGTVHYCGELSRDYEYFAGDNPVEAELVEIEGSFKAGREGAKSGVLMPAFPMVGQTYRQEWSLGNAEDAAEVLATDYSYGDDEDLDQLVPQDLAELLCDGDCVVTREFTPLEPDTEERKYYAPGVGLFLEINLEEEGVNRLVGCNVAPVCDDLP